METERSLDGFLLFFFRFLLGVGINGFVFGKPRQCFSRQASESPQVTVHDCFPLWMRLESSFSVSQQLLDLVLPNPVVLVRIEHRDKDEQVRPQVLQRDVLGDFDGVVRTFIRYIRT